MIGPRRAAVAILATFLLTGLPVGAEESPVYQEFVGVLHEHSGFSDGWPTTTPMTYFDAGKAAGLDFFGSAEHSDNADVPLTFSGGCATVDPGPASCVNDPEHLPKWEKTLEMANDASTPNFTAFRGFEWTSDRFGHINVYFSRNDTNAKTDGGYAATMETFWKWFVTGPDLGGGSDGIGAFNHPGDDGIGPVEDEVFNDFDYVPAADERMVGIELFNRKRNPYIDAYTKALDKGWHVGAIGAEDLHGDPGQDYAAPDWAKTVIIAPDRSRASLKAAMLARRFYAIRPNDGLRLEFSVDGAPMGSRLTREPGTGVHVVATAARNGSTVPDAVVELIGPGGLPLASSETGSIDTSLTVSSPRSYVHMRVGEKKTDGSIEWVGFGSPVWITAPPAQGEWLAGDLHVHTCYSHDAYCPSEVYGPTLGYNPPNGDNTGPEDFFTLSGTVEERFIEASARGLDYLAITDHHDDGHPDESGAHAVHDPGFGTHGVIGIPGYENSISGHAQMLGATEVISAGNKQSGDVNAMADELRARGGVFQANHPADPTDNTYQPMESCADTDELHWRYGYDVRVDTVEVWNIGHVLQPPVPSGTSNADALRYWECWLDRGVRVGATGGSDSHWLSTAAVQGPGNPTTWVFARERSVAGILQAIREGRTTISLTPPIAGELRLLLEADADGDGVYESMVGDTVAAQTPMRVRADGLPGGGLVRVRSNGKTIVDSAPLAPGGEVAFEAPVKAGWVHATLSAPDATNERREACDPLAEQLEQQIADDPIPNDPIQDFDRDVQQRAMYCRNPIAVMAQTSAMYVASPTTLTYVGETIGRGESVTVAARLTDGSDPLPGRKITFTVRDTTVDATTDNDGIARATVSVPDHGRSVVVEASYAGELLYAPSATTATITWGQGGGKEK